MQNQLCLRHWILALTQASRLLACTAWNSLADRMARPHQNLPVTFFAWFRSISFPHWDRLERSDQKARHPEELSLDVRLGKKEKQRTVGCCVVVCYYFHLLGKREMNGGINGWWVGGGEEEIPLSGWNWMASSGMHRGRDGGYLM